jgi:hypothetical protein
MWQACWQRAVYFLRLHGLRIRAYTTLLSGETRTGALAAGTINGRVLPTLLVLVLMKVHRASPAGHLTDPGWVDSAANSASCDVPRYMCLHLY